MRQPAMIHRDVIIIGAGASGLMCAREAAQRGRSVLVLDHAGRIGKKILVSGGGCCNFTNREVSADNYVSANRHFCKSALAQYSQHDFLDFLRCHGIQWIDRGEGQLFCEQSAAQIVTALYDDCKASGVEFSLKTEVQAITRAEAFEIVTNRGVFLTPSLVIATGGLAWPQLGATDFGLRLARQFRLKTVQTHPALVPFVFLPADQKFFSKLSGITLDVCVSCRKRSYRGSLLLTHKGMSGPPMLKVSNHWQAGDALIMDLFPDSDVLELLQEVRQSRMELQNVLSHHLPKRFCAAWCAACAPSRPLNSYSEKELKAVAEKLHAWSIIPAGTQGYKKAEVMAGGVDTGELSSKTMEAKKVPGLFFVGEVVDVTGELGGYNLQWAWSSGWAAGQVV